MLWYVSLLLFLVYILISKLNLEKHQNLLRRFISYDQQRFRYFYKDRVSCG